MEQMPNQYPLLSQLCNTRNSVIKAECFPNLELPEVRLIKIETLDQAKFEKEERLYNE